MSGGVFEDGGRLPMRSIYDTGFAADTNIDGYPTLGSDIPELSAMPRYR